MLNTKWPRFKYLFLHSVLNFEPLRACVVFWGINVSGNALTLPNLPPRDRLDHTSLRALMRSLCCLQHCHVVDQESVPNINSCSNAEQDLVKMHLVRRFTRLRLRGSWLARSSFQSLVCTSWPA